MPFSYQHKLSSFNTVAAGQTSALQLKMGPTYRYIKLKFTSGGAAPNEASMSTLIKRVRLKINGLIRIDISGANLIKLCKYYGLNFNNGEIVLPFVRRWMQTIQAEENVALGTANVNSVSLEVDVDAAAVSPTLEGWATIDPTPRDLGTIVEVQEVNYSTATTAVDIPNIPQSNGDLVAMHLGNGNFTDALLKINGVNIVENALEFATFLKDYKRVPQTGFLHIESTVQGRWDDVWPLVDRKTQRIFDVRLTGTLSAAGAVPIVLETLNQPLGQARI